MMHHLTKAILHGGAKLIGAQLRKRALPKKIMKKGGTEDEEVLCSKRGGAVAKPGAVFGSSKGDIILTSRRLAYFGNGLLKSVELHLPLWKISNVDFRKGGLLLNSYLSFQVDGQQHCFAIEGGDELAENLSVAMEAAAQGSDHPIF
ncbi:hypothetical protein [Prosthecobacter sp.]|uniref:hypothetical protein n=1 Tax=Prosthecobacter sp. TaxID=1965333 RepID=UPI00378529B7